MIKVLDVKLPWMKQPSQDSHAPEWSGIPELLFRLHRPLPDVSVAAIEGRAGVHECLKAGLTNASAHTLHHPMICLLEGRRSALQSPREEESAGILKALL